jgi:aspartyl-tRNA(Asn)/glutamyl-tRNA(Gln) amidotransferase subunit C
MSLSKEQVKKVAHLARIELTEAEVEKFQPQLAAILSYVEQLSAVDTQGVVATAQVTGLENVFRRDEVGACLDDDRQAALAQSPEVVANLVKVKSVFS